MNVKQYHGWVCSGSDSVFISEYLPEASNSRGSVIVAPPFGPEYMHCKASVRKLCFQLAEAGYSALSFDWPAYGNSTDELPAQQWLGRAEACVETLVQALSEKGDAPSLICLRSASLPAISTINQATLTHLFFWYPYTQGKALIRDFQLIDRTMSVPESSQSLTAGGYPLYTEDVAKLESLTLTQLSPHSCSSTFTIHSPEAKRLSYQKAFEDRGISFTSTVSTELRNMARQAELSKTPDVDIECIIQTLLNKPDREGYLDRLSMPTLTRVPWQESVLTYGETVQGFAIATQPVDIKASDECLIIPNTGSGHHSGPNGLHTRMARTMCESGISIIRMDLQHLGNSGRERSENSSDAYCLHAGSNIDMVARQLQTQGYTRLSLFGICAGAHSCFQYLRSSRTALQLNKVFLVNASTLYWTPDQDAWQPEKQNEDHEAHYHRKQAGSLKAWIHLLKTPSKWLRMASLVGLRLQSFVKKISGYRQTGENRFIKDCESIIGNAEDLIFVFSPEEPGEAILKKEGGSALKKLQQTKKLHWLDLANGDHTFTTVEDRTELINVVKQAFNNALTKKDFQASTAIGSTIADSQIH